MKLETAEIINGKFTFIQDGATDEFLQFTQKKRYIS